MSEHLRPALLALLLSPLPAMADSTGCEPLFDAFVFCAEGSAWQDARREDGQHVITFTADPGWLDIFRLNHDLYPPDAPLEAMIAAMEADYAGTDPDQEAPLAITLATDRFQTATLDVVALTNRVAYVSTDDAENVVTMIAEAEGRRIGFVLDTGEDTDAALLFDDMRAIADMIRPATGD